MFIVQIVVTGDIGWHNKSIHKDALKKHGTCDSIVEADNMLKAIFNRKNRNHRILGYLRKLSFPEANIKKALIVLNGLRYKDIANGQTSLANISKAIHSERPRIKEQQLISRALDIDPVELFQ
jgi:hypothetical protein